MCRGCLSTRVSCKLAIVCAGPPIPATRTISDIARAYGAPKYTRATRTMTMMIHMRRRRRVISRAQFKHEGHEGVRRARRRGTKGTKQFEAREENRLLRALRSLRAFVASA